MRGFYEGDVRAAPANANPTDGPLSCAAQVYATEAELQSCSTIHQLQCLPGNRKNPWSRAASEDLLTWCNWVAKFGVSSVE